MKVFFFIVVAVCFLFIFSSSYTSGIVNLHLLFFILLERLFFLFIRKVICYFFFSRGRICGYKTHQKMPNEVHISFLCIFLYMSSSSYLHKLNVSSYFILSLYTCMFTAACVTIHTNTLIQTYTRVN